MAEEMKEPNKEDINRRIAEACGWVKVRQHWEKDGESAYQNDSHCHRQLPDYCGSLDAISQAEATLDTEPMDVRSLWLDKLAIACDWPKTKNAAELRFETDYLCARATALQRAIAFLEVKG